MTLEYGVQHSSYSHYGKVNNAVAGCTRPQVAVFGSSVSEVGISPISVQEVTGLTCFNYSMDGTKFMQVKGIINAFLDHLGDCRYIVLTEFFGTFEKTTQLTAIDRYLAHIRNDHIYSSLVAIDRELVWKCRHVPFYRFIPAEHSYYKASFQGWQNILRGKDEMDVWKGFVPKELNWSPELDSVNQGSPKINLVIEPDIVESYRELLKRITGAGVQVLIILPPIQAEGRGLVNGLDRLRATFRGMESGQVGFMDLSTIPLTLDKSMFYNYSHVNTKGAAIFSDSVSAWLNRVQGSHFQ